MRNVKLSNITAVWSSHIIWLTGVYRNIHGIHALEWLLIKSRDENGVTL